MHTKNPQTHQKDTAQKSPRGGLGNKGNPLAIKYSIDEAMKDMQRTNHDLEKIKKNKEELLADLANLRISEKEAGENDSSEKVQELIKKNILNVQKKLAELNGIIPEVKLSDDQKKIQKIINEWDEAKKEKRNALAEHKKAETLLAEDPSNMRAMGQANRASATILSDTQRMEKVFNEAQIIKKNFTHNPVLDESVNIHTGEKEMGEKLVTQKSEKRDKELKEEHDPVRDEGISYTHKQSIADQKKYHETHKPIQKTSLPEKKVIGTAKKSIPPQIREYDYTKATKNLLLQMNRVLAKNKATISIAPKKKGGSPVFILKPAESHLLLNNGEHIPESRFTSLKKTIRDSFVRQTAEQQAKENQVPFLVKKILLHHLDILFGKSGFLGFGSRAGTDSPHWKDPYDGLSKKTVEDIFAVHQDAPQKDTSQCIGIKNYKATTKMKKYLSQASEQTKISPNPKETAEDYLVRAITTIFDKK